MKYLVSGLESKQRVELLLSLTKISSEALRDSIFDHLCVGHPEKDAAALNGVSQSNFNRAMTKLNDVAGIVEQIKELDWEHLKSLK